MWSLYTLNVSWCHHLSVVIFFNFPFWGGGVCVMTYIWKSEKNFGHRLSPLIKWNQFSRYGDRPLSHLTSHVLNLFHVSLFWEYSVQLHVTGFSISCLHRNFLGVLFDSPHSISLLNKLSIPGLCLTSLQLPTVILSTVDYTGMFHLCVCLPPDSTICGMFAHPAS